jgi:hypothetical protein
MSIASTRRAAPVLPPTILLMAAALLFTVLGLVLIPLAGIQNDEALFAAQLFTGGYPPYSLGIFGHHPPLMVFPYTGALKTYLYWPIFKIFAPGPYSLRIPVLLAGTLTILLFYYFARRIAGPRAAIFGAVLLATDPTFLLSNTFDWGPVALQHLLLVAALCLFVGGNLRVACFVCGFALWEKSVFLWPLAGLIAGGLAAYRTEIRAALFVHGALRKRLAAQAALAFLIGASPLIAYNIKSGNQTVRSTAHFSLDHLPLKAEELVLALNGDGLFRFIAAEDWETDHPKTGDSVHASIAEGIHDVLGDYRSSLFPYAAALALLAVPLWWRAPVRKPAVFAIVFCAATFACMAVTRDAGEAVHHSVLLWPMPQLLVGIVLATISWRWLSITLASVLALSNLLVINQYIFQLDRYGADGGFADAIYALSAQLPLVPENTPDDKIYVMDWGLTETLTLLHRGKLPLLPAAGPFFTATPDATGTQMIGNMLNDPHGLFLGHVAEREVFTGVRQRLEAAAIAAGYRKQIVEIVRDSNARPVFEVFRFQK